MRKKVCLFIVFLLVISMFEAGTTAAASGITLLPTPVTIPNTTILAVPPAPSSLKVAHTASGFDLSWEDNSNNETGFKIERKDASSEDFAEIAKADSNITIFKDETTVTGTAVSYRVRAYNKVGNSSYSNEATVKLTTIENITIPRITPTPTPTVSPEAPVITSPSQLPSSGLSDSNLPSAEIKDSTILKVNKNLEITIPDAAVDLDSDVEFLFPTGGEVIRKNQTVVIEFRVNKAGRYTVTTTYPTSAHSMDFEADTVYAMPWTYTGDERDDYKFQIYDRFEGNLIAESGEVTVGAQPEFEHQITATPGNESISLIWEPLLSLPGRLGYSILRSTISAADTQSFENAITDFPVTETSYVDITVDNGTMYYYTICAYVGGTNYIIPYDRFVWGTPQGKIVLVVGSPNMTVNGETQEIDPGNGTAPVLVNGRTFVPIRSIIECMGGTVSWDGVNKVTIELNNNHIELKIGMTSALVNGEQKELEVAPFISDTGRTMLPLRFITENLDCDVIWEWTTKTITIKY